MTLTTCGKYVQGPACEFLLWKNPVKDYTPCFIYSLCFLLIERIWVGPTVLIPASMCLGTQWHQPINTEMSKWHYYFYILLDCLVWRKAGCKVLCLWMSPQWFITITIDKRQVMFQEFLAQYDHWKAVLNGFACQLLKQMIYWNLPWNDIFHM